jgi:hypothetical protein
LDFSGKVALVTGAASGMGLAMAQAVAEGGAAVALVDFKEDAVKAAEQRLVAATENRETVAGKSEEYAWPNEGGDCPSRSTFSTMSTRFRSCSKKSTWQIVLRDRSHRKTNAMKRSLIIIFCVLSIFTGLAFADNPKSASNQMRIKIGSSAFTATLYDNPTSTAFKGMLPMSVKMSDMNGNEKYFDLPVNLPTNASNPGKIEIGDLMIYGSNTLVLFYETFSTSYRYTKLGRINDIKGLAAAVGSGSVMVTYELE